jgi:DNA segregation ATPase FtsK/SpoIIIE, S-DNA-T family
MKLFEHISEKTKNEIIAILFFALSIILFLSLITHLLDLTWMGRLGWHLANMSFFVFGRYVSFLLAGLIFLWGVGEFRGQTPLAKEKILIRVFGAVILVISLCTLLALAFDPYMLQDRNKNFVFGGFIGAYVTTKSDWFGLGIPQIFGPVGSYIFAVTGVLIGIVLTTEFLFSAYLIQLKSRWAERWKSWRQKEPAVNVGAVAVAPAPVINTKVDEEKVTPRIMVDEAVKKLKAEKKVIKPIQKPPQPGEYILPSLDLLYDPPPQESEKRIKEDMLEDSKKLEETLTSFGIQAHVVEVNRGPVVTRYELQPAPGVKISSITGLSNDIALVMRASHVRIAAIPGKAAVGIEIPNRTASAVYLREILSSDAFTQNPSKLAMALGKTIAGEPYVTDLARMPHLLVAGTTGSGKSVCVNSMIASILFRATPDEVKFIMVDPKRVELSIYNNIPHLLTPIVTEAKKACRALKWAVTEMDRRYSLFADLGVRDIDSYNKLVDKKKLESKTQEELINEIPLEKAPLIVIFIDELADLMMVARADNEDMITRLAQMARAVGIHLVLATQRPSVDVITGLIKANFPSRIAFQVSSKVDSRTILDGMGAEALLGRGDMLFSPGGTPKPIRLQGPYISNDEIQAITEYICAQQPAEYALPSFDNVALDEEEEGPSDAKDELYEEALRIVKKTKQASASMLQTHLGIGYPRARKIIEIMEREGFHRSHARLQT